MLGQLSVEPDPELDVLDPEPVPELELDEPVLVLPDPVLEVVDVVAALAASAPPAKSPAESALTARTLRKRMCMTCCPFVCGVLCGVVCTGPLRTGTAHVAPPTCGVPQSERSALVELLDDPMTIHRCPRRLCPGGAKTTHSEIVEGSQARSGCSGSGCRTELRDNGSRAG
jgi:hypothetical protein